MPEIGIPRSVASEKIVSKISDGRNSQKSPANMPIAMYDSGVGGLSVLKEVMRQLPGEDVIYFADTARVPYGGKSPQEIIKINYEVVDFLLSLNIKMIIIACGTSSAIAYPIIKEHYKIHFVSLIEPAAEAAVFATKNNCIGVIATQATIDSGSYENELKKNKNDIKVVNSACPLFVPLIERGSIESQETKLAAARYLKPLIKEGIDTLILGCTHYAFLAKILAEILGPKVELINPAEKAVFVAKNFLVERGLASFKSGKMSKSKYHFYASGPSGLFADIGSKLLEYPISKVKQAIFPKSKRESGHV